MRTSRLPLRLTVAVAVPALLASVAAGHLVAAFVGPPASPYVAVGAAVVDLTPGWLKDVAISTFGTADKAVLLTCVAAVLLLLALAAGALSRRRPGPGLAVIAGCALVAIAAVLTRPDTGQLAVLAPLAGLLAGWTIFATLHRRARDVTAKTLTPSQNLPSGVPHPSRGRPHAQSIGGPRRGRDSEARDAELSTVGEGCGQPGVRQGGDAKLGGASAEFAGTEEGLAGGSAELAGGKGEFAGGSAELGRGSAELGRGKAGLADGGAGLVGGGVGRRRFLLTGLGVAAGAGLAGGIGQWVIAGKDAEASRGALPAIVPARAAPAVPAGADFADLGTPTFLTANRDFYRIDTALVVPQVRAEGWSLRIHGMVERELTLDYQAIRGRELVERPVTLSCVSNEVGGELISTANFTGIDLRELLLAAGVRPGAQQVLSTSTDGFTAGTPLDALLDPGRGAMLAIGMNGEPLPVRHGFPARLVVPGLYGYVSATKWVTELEVTTWAARPAYWTVRGWAEQAPVKTQSRIDRPRGGGIPAGQTVVAGVAWAQHTGVDRVELRVDDGPWREATLSTEISVDTWRMWWQAVDLRPGAHRLTVRATDRGGYTQTERRTPVTPDGATGWHSVTVTAR